MTGVDLLDVPLRPTAEKFCQRCGTRFTPASTVGRPPKYCGEACTDASWQDTQNAKRKAARAQAHEARVAELGGRTCQAAGCDNELPAPKPQGQPPRFCSGACRVRAHRAAKRQAAAA